MYLILSLGETLTTGIAGPVRFCKKATWLSFTEPVFPSPTTTYCPGQWPAPGLPSSLSTGPLCPGPRDKVTRSHLHRSKAGRKDNCVLAPRTSSPTEETKREQNWSSVHKIFVESVLFAALQCSVSAPARPWASGSPPLNSISPLRTGPRSTCIATGTLSRVLRPGAGLGASPGLGVGGLWPSHS